MCRTPYKACVVPTLFVCKNNGLLVPITVRMFRNLFHDETFPETLAGRADGKRGCLQDGSRKKRTGGGRFKVERQFLPGGVHACTHGRGDQSGRITTRSH